MNKLTNWIKSHQSIAFFDMVITQDGNVLVVGTTNHLNMPLYPGDALFMKLPLDGDVLWEKTWRGDGYEQAQSVIQASDGGYLVAGLIQIVNGRSCDTIILRTDVEGWVEK